MTLKELVKNHGLDQVKTASMMGCSTGALNRYLSEKQDIPLERLVNMRRAAVEGGNVALALDVAVMIRQRTVIQVGPAMNDRVVRAQLLGEISWELKQMGKKPSEVRALLREVLS